MALFFDVSWYDARLAERGLDRAALAAAAGLSPGDLALAFKDQRHLSAAELAAFAELLGVTRDEAASRAGTRLAPEPDSPLARQVAGLEARLARVEALLARLSR